MTARFADPTEALAADDLDVFLEKVRALEASIRELRKPFSFDPSKRQCLNEGMIDAAFSNMLSNITPIRTNAMALQSSRVLHAAEMRRRENLRERD